MGLIGWIAKGFGLGLGGALARDAYQELKDELKEPTAAERARLEVDRRRADKAAAKARKKADRARRAAQKKQQRAVEAELRALKKKL